MTASWATAIHRWDNPETVRLRKYLTGTHLLLQVVEVEAGATPKDEVWVKGPVRLFRYRTGGERTYDRPVVLAYPPLLRSFIVDLVPGVSLARYLVEEGFDVYLLDFGVPGYAERDIRLEDFVLGHLPAAVDEVLHASQADGVTLVGHCMAGTMGAMWAALSPDGPVRNLALVAAPVDFAPRRPGLLGSWTFWTRQRHLDPGPFAHAAGRVGGDRMIRLLEAAAGRAWPWRLSAEHVATDPSLRAWLAVCAWVDEGVPFPGAAYQEWYRDLFQRNALIEGKQRLAGERVDLGRLTCPVLAVAGTLDAVTPVTMARPWPDVVGSSDAELVELAAGHVGMMVGPAGPGDMWPRLRRWLAPRSAPRDGGRVDGDGRRGFPAPRSAEKE